MIHLTSITSLPTLIRPNQNTASNTTALRQTNATPKSSSYKVSGYVWEMKVCCWDCRSLYVAEFGSVAECLCLVCIDAICIFAYVCIAFAAELKGRLRLDLQTYRALLVHVIRCWILHGIHLTYVCIASPYNSTVSLHENLLQIQLFLLVSRYGSSQH